MQAGGKAGVGTMKMDTGYQHNVQHAANYET